MPSWRFPPSPSSSSPAKQIQPEDSRTGHRIPPPLPSHRPQLFMPSPAAGDVDARRPPGSPTSFLLDPAAGRLRLLGCCWRLRRECRTSPEQPAGHQPSNQPNTAKAMLCILTCTNFHEGRQARPVHVHPLHAQSKSHAQSRFPYPPPTHPIPCMVSPAPHQTPPLPRTICSHIHHIAACSVFFFF